MITAVEIENFKGIRERTRIEIKPVTLLFGPNSAGKSTLLHALQLAREIFVRHNLDADATDGGGSIDLGGFRNYVHGRDMGRSVVLRFDLDLSDTNFLTEVPIPECQVPVPGGEFGETLDLATIGDDIRSGWVEIVIGCFEPTDPPMIQSYSVSLDGELFARTCGNQVWRLNIHHPLVRWAVPDANSFGVLDHLVPATRPWPHQCFMEGEPIDRKELLRPPPGVTVARTKFPEGPDEWELRVHLATHHSVDDCEAEVEHVYAKRPDSLQVRLWGIRCPADQWNAKQAKRYLAAIEPSDALPRGNPFPPSMQFERAGFEDDANWAWLDNHVDLYFQKTDEPVLPYFDQDFDAVEWLMNYKPVDTADSDWRYRCVLFSKLLTRLLFVPGRVVRKALDELRYVGPVRDAVPRHFSAPNFPDPRRWAGGLAAWEALTRDTDSLAGHVSRWLSDEDQLNTGYGVKVEQYRELPLDHDLSALLESGRVLDDTDPDEIKNLIRALPVKRRPVLVALATRQPMHPADVGQGITQAVPVVVAALLGFGGDKPRGGLVAIEQPELHLNPRQQAALGDVFLWAALAPPKNRFILETHSEHLILRLQRRIREATARREGGGKLSRKPPVPPPDREPSHDPLRLDVRDSDIGVVYVRQRDGVTLFEPMPLDLTGDFVMPWPDDFFEIDFYERFGHDR